MRLWVLGVNLGGGGGGRGGEGEGLQHPCGDIQLICSWKLDSLAGGWCS